MHNYNTTKKFRLPTLKDLLKESTANVLYFGGQAVLFLALTPKLLIAFGEELYGIWTILLSVLVLSGYLNIGSIAAIVKFTSKYSTSEEHNKELAASLLAGYSIVVFFSILIAGIFSAFSTDLANLIKSELDKKVLAKAFFIIAIGIIPHYVSQASRAVLWGLMKSRLALTIFFIHDILLWFGALFIAKQLLGVVYLAYWILIVNSSRLFITTLLVLLSLRSMRLNFKWDQKIAKSLFSFSLMDWIGIIGVSMFSIIPKIEVGWVLNASAAGVYGIAAGIGVRITALADYLSQALLPYISGHYQGNNLNKVREVYSKAFGLISVLLIIGTILLMIFMKYFLNFWISQDFSENHSTLFSLMAAAFGFYAIFSPSIRAMEGLGLIKWRSMIQLISGICVVLFIWILGKKFGLMGVMAATWSLSLNAFAHLLVLKKIKKEINEEIKNIFLILSILLANALIIYFNGSSIISYLNAFVSIIILFAISYKITVKFRFNPYRN